MVEESGRHILVVDDDERIRKLLKRYLSSHGYSSSAVGDVAEAKRLLGSVSFDLLVVDVMMPGETGLDLTRDVRAESDVPILMLTARAESDERIEGLEHGASDYLTKPFEPRELLLRVRNLLRPRAKASKQGVRAVVFGEFRFDTNDSLLYQNGMRITLTGAESKLLDAFAKSPGRIFSRMDICRWGDVEQERSIDVRINRLRRKIEPNPRYPIYLQTLRGQGYVFRPDEIIYTPD